MIEIKTVKGIKNAPDAVDIRTEVFVDEQGFVEEFDALDESATFVLLYDNGTAVATGRVIDLGGGRCKLGRIAVRKSRRQSGIGRALMDALESAARGLGANCIQLSAQYQAQGFYEKCGYTAHGELFNEENYPHIAMEKAL